MLYFMSYLFKVFFSVVSSYSLVLFSKAYDDKEFHLRLIVLFSFFISSLLGILYLVSINSENINIVSIGIIICALFLYFISKNIELEHKFDYFFSYFACVGITLGYIFHSFIILLLYYYIKNNIEILLFSNKNSSFDKEIIDDNE